LAIGGYQGPNQDDSYEYDGTSWSTGGLLSTARARQGSCGTQSAGLAFGGSGELTSTEEYNGTSWSAGGALANGRRDLAGAGTQTAGLSFGGYRTDSNYIADTEEYNGTSWSAGGDLVTGRNALGGCGTQSAGLSFGGGITVTVTTNATEEYNGTSWATSTVLNTSRDELSGCGTQTAGLSFGGTTGALSDVSEEYDGATWSIVGSLIFARTQVGGCGTQAAGLVFGGNDGSILALTEEYNQPITVGAYKISASTYESAGAETSFTINAGHLEGYDVGLLFITKDDDVAVDSITGWTQQLGFESNNAIYSEVWKRDCDGTETTITVTGDSEEYVATLIAIEGADYASIANVTNALGTNAAPTSNSASVTSGDYLALSAFGVDGDSNPYTPDVDLSEIASLQSTTGANSAGMYVGYEDLSTVTTIPSYASTIDSADQWTAFTVYLQETTDIIVRVSKATELDSADSAAVVDKINPRTIPIGVAGSSGKVWIRVADLLSQRKYSGGAGTQTSGLAFGGTDNTNTYSISNRTLSTTEEWDGTAWASGGDLSTSRQGLAGNGTQSAALSIGGYSGWHSICCFIHRRLFWRRFCCNRRI
jgi:hypothetical protein